MAYVFEGFTSLHERQECSSS